MPEATTTRDRILVEAMRLFAEHGYASTSVRAIEEAAGLAPGGGGLYRHFPSKAEILAAAIRRHEDEAARATADDADLLSEWAALPLREALDRLARRALAQLADQRDLMRVLFRDLDAFPDLRDEFRERQVQATYAGVAAWIDAEVARRGLAPLDAAALSAVALGALVNHRLIGTLLGEVPGGVDEDRLVAMWVELVAGRLERG